MVAASCLNGCSWLTEWLQLEARDVSLLKQTQLSEAAAARATEVSNGNQRAHVRGCSKRYSPFIELTD